MYKDKEIRENVDQFKSFSSTELPVPPKMTCDKALIHSFNWTKIEIK